MVDLFPSRVKICGITNFCDALAAVECGAKTLGFVFYPPSPRAVTPYEAQRIIQRLPDGVIAVGVFVDRPAKEIETIAARCRLSAVQLHGQESEELLHCLGLPAIKALRVRSVEDLTGLKRYPGAAAYLLDAWSPQTAGGTGEAWDWTLGSQMPALDKPLVLAGGLTPDNVAQAISQVRPYALDVSSGVERSPGRKDHEKMRRFVDNVQETFDAYPS